jgi:dTDP-4-dehydrorhamnose 3,5-epimerase
MKVVPTALPEVLLVEPRCFADSRGHLFEAYAQRRYREAGIVDTFVQINQSHSVAGVVRGLHYQLGDPPQAKLVRVVRGRILDVAVDLRRGGPRFGRHVAVELSADNRRQLYLPPGFAHGFCALEPSDVLYLQSAHYAPELERGVRHDDPRLAIHWPVSEPLISERDAPLPLLSALSPDDLPPYP